MPKLLGNLRLREREAKAIEETTLPHAFSSMTLQDSTIGKKPMTLRSYSPSEVEEYHRLPLKEKRTLQQMSKKNIAERASDYFEREASALLRQT
ncbi:hypothetical protein CTI12_AA077520 [Artemisia annua]|uniref:Uncharacterized protein n=1 Tax=Artemisia annua TaxID=35608 RepID=A0A2U1Q492_ARTAN|nr:hypothetical protein CTI12_AA077520 [Artemisia annua]